MTSSDIVPAQSVYPDLLAYNVAINQSTSTGLRIWTDEELCADHGITIEEFEKFKTEPAFKKEVLMCLKDVKENGDNIRIKARHLFEHYLDSWVPTLFVDEEAPAAEKNKALAFLGKVGRVVDDKPTSNENQSGGSTTNIASVQVFLAPQPVRVEKVVNEPIEGS